MAADDKPIASLEAACEKYLAGLGCSNWGQAYSIYDPKRREVAAKWLAREIAGVLVVAEEAGDD